MKNIISGTPIFLSGDVDEKMLYELDKGLVEAFKAEEKKATVILTTVGGLVIYGEAIAERLTIANRDLDLKIIAATFVQSAGVQIFLSLPKEKRLITRRCEIMIHPAKRGIKYLEGSTALAELERKLLEELEHTRASQKMEKELISQLVQVTGIKHSELAALYRKSHRFSAKDAVRYNLASAIVP